MLTAPLCVLAGMPALELRVRAGEGEVVEPEREERT